MKKEVFIKLKLAERYTFLKSEGEFVASRDLPLHRAHLFVVSGLYVEMYIQKATNCIQWIEIQDNLDIQSEYLNDLEINL